LQSILPTSVEAERVFPLQEYFAPRFVSSDYWNVTATD